jgi:ribosomal protein S18 acetylase RimI-like enzyme
MMVSAKNDPRRAGTIWAMNLDEPTPVVTPLLAVTFRRLGPDSAPALATALDGDTAGEVLKRFDTGRRCYTAWVNGSLAAYGWVSFDEEFIGELSLRLTLLPGEAYIWDCVTLPAYRQHHLFTALLVYILGELRADPLCRVWIGANLENVASQRGIARAGFRRVADLVVARVLAMRLVWVQGHPGVPDHLVAQARRAFLGDRDKAWLSAVSTATSYRRP